jgi:lysine 2,3-aminomutase
MTRQPRAESATEPFSLHPQRRPFPERWPEEYRALALSLGAQSALLKVAQASAEEDGDDPEALPDPVGERTLSPTPFLVRKYGDRVLFLCTSVCHSYCRFCFRRATPPGRSREPSSRDRENAVAWVAAHPEVREVILSGGDPLTLPDADVARLLRAFAQIPHVERLRIHSRAPVTCPDRIDAPLAQTLGQCDKPLSLVIHATHVAEMRPASDEALDRLQAAGVRLENQTVLLREVNDDAQSLAQLFGALATRGIPTRYLHHPDRAPGNQAFRVSIARGLAIHQMLREAGGPAPAYVIDLPNGAGKAPVASLTATATQEAPHRRRIRYRWVRPQGWEGWRAAPDAEWWDIWENMPQGESFGDKPAADVLESQG